MRVRAYFAGKVEEGLNGEMWMRFALKPANVARHWKLILIGREQNAQ